MSFHLRWMIRRDMAEVLQIESSLDSPWSENDFISLLRKRNVIGMSVESPNGQVIAHMIYSLHKNYLEVERFVVHPEFRRQGIGTLMLNKLKVKLSLQRRVRVWFNVEETNLDLQLFLREKGFRAVSILYPAKGWVNAKDEYRFVYALHPENVEEACLV